MNGHRGILHRRLTARAAPKSARNGPAAPSRCFGSFRPHFSEHAGCALVFLPGAQHKTMKTDWTSYPSPGFHDELVGPGGGPRAAGRALVRYLTEMDGDEIAVR